MSSRTPMAVQPRQPQRGSGSAMPGQRPAQQDQRGISSSQQQYLSPSPARRDASFLTDPNSDSNDAMLGARHVSTPMRQRSKLRLELSNENVPAGPLSGVDSPQTLTPARVMPVSDAMDTDSLSPALSRGSQLDTDNPPLPMPRRRHPHTSQPVPVGSTPAPAPSTTKKDVRPKPYIVEMPPDAPRFVHSKRREHANRDPFSKGLFSGSADFFPWSGSHHEDQWNTEAIQKGTWDRGSQNEASSARLAIFPALKQKSGLNALSTIFMGVLNQRRHRGQVTAPSTFKPPPRVTLTDTKREIWLKDLANPAISLRRLSRTIPHGIRGRTLLDQCLNKDVPTERAVWLVKCVGANEIRAVKRKGASGAFFVGGDVRWTREWTSFVEQFLEAAVAGFNEPNWKSRVTYAIRLATCLYSEHLLDRDHYMDWMMSGLETSSQSRIPMWILIAQIYWRDILGTRKYGRRLVFSLLNHLHTIDQDPDRDILIQLSSQLSILLNALLQSNPESFVHPSAWQRLGETMGETLAADDAIGEAAYRAVKTRNAKLLVANTTSAPSGRQHLVQLLDATLQGRGVNRLSATCWSCMDDKQALLRTVVEWATSVHRTGLAKVYAAATLIESWTPFGAYATSVILDVLADISPSDGVRKNLLIRMVDELVRSGRFSVPQYMQWLIGRGGLHSVSDIDSVEGPCASRLLIDLPVYCLTDDDCAQRASLLRRAGNYSVAEEANDIAAALKYVDACLGLGVGMEDASSPSKTIPFKKLLRRIGMSSRAVQMAIGSHVSDSVASLLLDGANESAMSLDLFVSIRALMESIEDFAMLEKIVKSFTNVSDVDLLSSCVDTVNANLDVFLALGSGEDLFDMLLERLRCVNREQGISVRPLIVSLSLLAPRLRHRDDVAKQLADELVQNDRSIAIDACSPVSDSMAAQGHGAEGEVSEQIDKLLANGNTIDHPTMNRLFRQLAPKLEAGWAKLDGSRRVFASLLARLRILDAMHFDKLMADWVSHIRTLDQRQPLVELFPLLVSMGCLSMATLLRTATAASAVADTARSSPRPAQATYLQELLHMATMTLPTTASLDPEESYRFRVHQQRAKFEHAGAMLLLVRNALVEYTTAQSTDSISNMPMDDAMFQDAVLEILRLLVVTDSANVAETLNMASLPTAATAMARKIFNKLLLPPAGGDETQTSFDKILLLANELTMPFCQLKLNLDLAAPQTSSDDAEADSSSRFEGFTRAMNNAIEAQNIMWTSMLPCLSEDITQSLNNEAYSKFLDLMPSAKSNTVDEDATDEQRIRLAENLLGVVEAIISGQPPSKAAPLTSTLVDKLSDLSDIIVSSDKDRPAARKQVLNHWLPALLRFIVLHSISSDPGNAATPGPSASAKAVIVPASHEARARIILVLCGLLLDIEALSPEESGSIGQQILDIAIVLIDGLPDDLRAQCAKSVLFLPGATATTKMTSDPRLYYLFSAAHPTAAENLKLAHRDKSAMPYSATARGIGAMYGIGPTSTEKLSPFLLRRWEILSEPTPNVGENDTSLSLGLFEAIKIQ